VASRAHTAEHSPVSPPSLPRCRRRQLLLRPPPATTVAFVRRRRTAHIYYTGFPLAPCQSAPKCDIKANPSLVARAHRGGSDTSNSSAPPRHGRLHQFHAASLAPRLLGRPSGNPICIARAAGAASSTSSFGCTFDAPELLSVDLALWCSYWSTTTPSPSTLSIP
jgi:hypothetical protein